MSKEFQISYVYEDDPREHHKIYSADTKRDAERKFYADLMDASEDVPEKATITRILNITDRIGLHGGVHTGGAA